MGPPFRKNKYVSDENVIYLKCYYNSKSNCGGLYNCQTKHLLAETAGRNLSSLKANRPFTKRKASRTNHKDALTAELQRRIANGMVGVMAIAALRDKCIPLDARSAAGKPKCPLGPHPTDLYIAKIAISPEIEAETDINSSPAPTSNGRGLLLSTLPPCPPSPACVATRSDLYAHTQGLTNKP